jgi:hypothetical protein
MVNSRHTLSPNVNFMLEDLLKIFLTEIPIELQLLPKSLNVTKFNICNISSQFNLITYIK